MSVRVFAPAKVNLTLHVTGQRDDGYHLLDSLVVFADVGDMVLAHRSTGLSLEVTGPEAANVPVDDSNSMLKAAQFMGADDLALKLEKHLPTAAGIGGGTADAAATLRAISRLYGIEMPDDLLPLGADVPVCLRGHATRMSGVGEVLQDVFGLPDIWAVLVNPRVQVSTQDIFKALKSKENAAMPAEIPRFETSAEFASWLAAQRNDLQEAAISVQPIIATALKALNNTDGALIARMSGSGASCFALFEDGNMAGQAAVKMRENHPDWWVRDCRLS